MGIGRISSWISPPRDTGGCSLLLVSWRSPLLVMMLVLAVAKQASGGGDGEVRESHLIVALHEDHPWQEFTHLTVDKNTGTVYVGGENRLYQLDPNLQQVELVVTGPVNDSVECPAIDCWEDTFHNIKPTKNVNKVLVIDYTRSRLIVCGTVRQGSCQVRALRNITQLTRNVNEAIVANDATASTVAFIAPGPPNPPMTDVLYIGVTYTGRSVYRDEVPAVASRSLEDDRLFDIAMVTVTTSTGILINSLYRDHYPITYVYGFGSENFSYFLTRQKAYSGDLSPYISKLVRVCQNDSDYYSYTEIPIECKDSQGTRYNLVQAAYVGKPGTDLATQLGIRTNDDILFAVFSPSDPAEREGSPRPAESSALCVYSMKSMRRIFVNNIQECFRGKGYRGLDFISPSHRCIETRLHILNEDFCGLGVNTPLGGEQPVETMATLTLPIRLTAVAASSTENYSVVFLGTAQGHLKKVAIENQNNALEYDDIAVDQGSPVRQDMHFDKTGDHLYVMTSNKISKVKVQACNIYEGCSHCLGSRDPHCGWCSLRNKCSLRRDCRDSTHDLQHWVNSKTGRCPTITSVMPDKLQRTSARTLSLMIDYLPSVPGALLCVFSTLGKDLTTNAKRTAEGVSCTTPRTAMLPDILQNEHHFTTKLCVVKSEGPEFVCTNFTFFDCNTFSSCTECVSSPFPCDWCVDNHRCTHDSAENCRNDVLVNGVNQVGPSIRRGPSFCPRISFLDSQEILVSSGTEKSIKIKVDNIPQFITQTEFACKFNSEGKVITADAQLLGDTLHCDIVQFAAGGVPSINVTFAVMWARSKPLDNPNNIHVLVYRCHLMADNCGMCLILPERYKCGWCQSTRRCEVTDQCRNQSWLDRDRTCPNINITNFYPRSGPWEGGTNVTIEGINLGKQIDDIYEGITVAGISCQPFNYSYVKTKIVTCMVDSPGTNDFKEGPVVVKVAGDYRGESLDKYRFVNPVITDVTPDTGPASGGTLLHISGKFMNAGSRIEAFTGGRPCRIQTTNASTATCITTSGNKQNEGNIEMTFDNGRRNLNGTFFTYVDDPTIHSVKSGRVGQAGVRNGPRGIPAGGIIITVDGTNFNAIREPKMYVVYRSTEYTSPCQVKNTTRMECKTPAVDVESSERIDEVNGMKLGYGFIMDHVLSVRDLEKADFPPFLLFTNPEYFVFKEDDQIKDYKSDYLTIDGKNLDRASLAMDVEVLIGADTCNVISLLHSQLICQPPEGEPAPLDNDNLPRVVVIVGGTLRFGIGYLRYASTSDVRTLSFQFIIGLCVGAVVFILILVVILCRQKNNQNTGVLKTMQEQMDMMELRIASECNEAFAELQTEMTDLTSDVISGGLPFLDYRTYAMKILFPNLEETTLLQMDRPDLKGKEKGLKLFGQLIMNKTFLLIFIQTLELDRYIAVRDRVNVASLIMVALQGKMEYCSDILKTLLAESIKKCTEGKIQPKQLFTRTESVAEKMLSSWFTFLLYKFLKEGAGEPLYMLFRAIKCHVDKGPVNAVTSEAKYSLSEEKLICQSIDYKKIVVYVSMSNLCMGGINGPKKGGETPVQVLDCDTISQVKEKSLDAIFLSYPYSQRPTTDDLDLECDTGPSGPMILCDEDTTTEPQGGWKKLNTLGHYNVPDQAHLTLIPKLSTIYNNVPVLLDESDESHHKYEVWHLVRQHASKRRAGERTKKMVSEIHLTRLLSTKLTLQKFVDDLFETIFSTTYHGSAVPVAIKYMFDFLDEQAVNHGITDPEVVHTWKCNSLPLGFWGNLIKNPDFIFDIHKSNIVDACLSVVAQAFIDSCSPSDHTLVKNSPSSKLLYAKDTHIYKGWVDRYYADIKLMQPISDQDMNAMLAEESKMHHSEFNRVAALAELYGYAFKYSDQLMLSLEEDEFSIQNRLACRLELVHSIMNADQD